MTQWLVDEHVTEQAAGEARPAHHDAIVGANANADRPRVYYGWAMVLMSTATLVASSPGQTFGVSILNEPMRMSLGLSHSQLAAAYMLGTLFGAIPITFVGHMMDRYGLRSTMLLSISLFAFACLSAASVQGWLTLVFAFFLLRSLGPGALAFLSGNTLAFWFDRHLGTVEGLRQLGMAIAMAFIPVLNIWLIHSWGWRGAYVCLGCGVWLALFPAAWLLFRERPEDVGQSIDGGTRLENGQPSRSSTLRQEGGLTLGEALRTATFWIVAGGTALYGAIHTAVFFCLVPIFEERGLTGADAAMTLTVYAACFAVMQLIGGTAADFVRAPVMLFAGLLGLSVSILLLDYASTRVLAQLSGAALGASQGAYFGAAHPLWARYFGRRHLGTIRGVLMTIIVAISSLGPLFAGIAKDWTGDFRLALTAFAIAPMPIAVLSLFVRRPQWNRQVADDALIVAIVD